MRPTVAVSVSRAGLSREVVFAGYQAGEEFVRWLQALDVLWVLGLGNDWSARVAAQARACGVRVIAANEGALPDYADVVLTEVTADAIVRATLSDARVEACIEAPDGIAREVLSLYEAVQ